MTLFLQGLRLLLRRGDYRLIVAGRGERWLRVMSLKEAAKENNGIISPLSQVS